MPARHVFPLRGDDEADSVFKYVDPAGGDGIEVVLEMNLVFHFFSVGMRSFSLEHGQVVSLNPWGPSATTSLLVPLQSLHISP